MRNNKTKTLSANVKIYSRPRHGKSRTLCVEKTRYDCFDRYWRPQSHQNAFSEQTALPFDDQRVDLGASPHQPHLPSLAIEDELLPRSRDRIFYLVTKTAGTRLNIPSFPPTGCLDILLKVGIAKRTESDAWIHPFTFSSETSRIELLTALIAAGCVCFGKSWYSQLDPNHGPRPCWRRNKD